MKSDFMLMTAVASWALNRSPGLTQRQLGIRPPCICPNPESSTVRIAYIPYTGVSYTHTHQAILHCTVAKRSIAANAVVLQKVMMLLFNSDKDKSSKTY